MIFQKHCRLIEYVAGAICAADALPQLIPIRSWQVLSEDSEKTDENNVYSSAKAYDKVQT